MRKIFMLGLAVMLSAACSTVNKNTLSYKLSQVNGEKFLTTSASGDTKNAAEAAAKQEMNARLSAAGANSRLASDIYNHAFIEQAWKDKTTKRYYAIAALERKVGKDMIVGEITELDGQLNGLARHFDMTTDKFLAIKTALKIQPLVEQRNQLQGLYETLDYNGNGYEAEKYANLKNVLYDSMNKIKISLTVLGKNSEVLHTHLINAVNEMGLAVAINEPADISIDVNSEITEYPSKVVNGLMWCSATGTVGLKDMATGGVFARFSISDRQGSSRSEDAVRRTMDAIGQKAEGEMKTRITNYLEKR